MRSCIGKASPNYFAEDNVIVTLEGEGVRAMTLSLVKAYVSC